jgi:hypothetical protein
MWRPILLLSQVYRVSLSQHFQTCRALRDNSKEKSETRPVAVCKLRRGSCEHIKKPRRSKELQTAVLLYALMYSLLTSSMLWGTAKHKARRTNRRPSTNVDRERNPMWVSAPTRHLSLPRALHMFSSRTTLNII